MAVTKVYANTLSELNASRMDGERLRRIVEAGSVDTALKMLGDYGYAVADGTIDGFIVEETNALIAFVEEYAATEKAKNALIAPFWYNNVKLAYKSRFVDVPADGYYRTEFDAAKVKLGDYSDCDRFLTEALTALDAAEEKRPQAIDLAITRAMYRCVCACGIARIKNYFRTEIDLKNILTAARMKKLGKSGDEFIPGGRLKPERLNEAAFGEDFADCFAGTPYEEQAERIQENGFSDLWQFERDADEHLYLITDSLCANMSSYEPFLKYYTKARTELKTIKTALVCIKTGSRDVFYSRMPKLFE